MIAIKREDLLLMLEAGYVYLAMRRYADARAVFEGVAVLAPTSDVPLVAMGNVYFSQCQYKRALSVYEKALHVNPRSAVARAYMGESLLFDGKKEAAVNYLEEAIALEGDGPTVPFARSLLDLIDRGFDPHALRGAGRLHGMSAQEALR